ncbi:endonuclease MutS2 [Halodesulfovibrio sp.]|uniref:endonuclease MutS2 n=1 Tax=Halodesulfovibrio sp. TaxID=1912772 RepID=UPI0025C12AAB|nr:endonuclease MutS2 [Halodesulfovibrio sp.]
MEQRTIHNLEFRKVLERLADFAVSEAGTNACLSISPVSSHEEAQEQAQLFRQGQEWSRTVSVTLSSFPDLAGMFSFIDSPTAVLDLDDLWALRQVLVQARDLRASIRVSTDDSPWPLLLAMVDKFPWPEQCASGLSRCVGDDGLIRDNSSPDLLLIRQEIRRIHQTCTRKVKDFVNSHGILQYLQDEYITLASDRYVLPLKSNFKGRVQGIIHDYSQTGETCYFEPMFLVDLNNELAELKKQEREEEHKVLEFLTGLVRANFGALHGVYSLMVNVDVLLAKCTLASKFNGVALDFNQKGNLHLVDALHPLLALSDGGALPVTLELLPEQFALLISGGNAGGKTVCLKTIGLIALMAMSGLPVPVKEGSSIPFWKNIFAFIGDEQSLEENVSTFTAQITNLSAIWDTADDSTLVILDEFGAGTDPAQGAALAQAVIDELLDRGAYVCAATHFPALKAYALSNDRVRAASVLFDPSTKKPLYRLAYDQVGASQALDVAREHGMPDYVLRRAEQYLLMDGEDTSALIDRLNTLAVEREREVTKLDSERQRFEERRKKLNTRYERERDKLFGDIQKEAQNVLNDLKTQKVTHKQALKELAKTRQKLVEANKAEQPKVEALAPQEITPGQTLKYNPWKKSGVVEEIDDKRGKVKINLSGVAMWVNLHDVSFADETNKTVQAPRTTVKAERKASFRVDLRGKRADVAISELDSFIDKALLSNIEELEVVHGKGTGALRREIHTYLKNAPAVATFRLAPADLGGDGMTIVELR